MAHKALPQDIDAMVYKSRNLAACSVSWKAFLTPMAKLHCLTFDSAVFIIFPLSRKSLWEEGFPDIVEAVNLMKDIKLYYIILCANHSHGRIVKLACFFLGDIAITI